MNSTENPETLADIVRELRDYADSLDYAGDYEPAPNTEPLRDIADRIEAAAERERKRQEALRINECIVSREEEASEWQKRIGNAAAMREALEVFVHDFASFKTDVEHGNLHMMQCMDFIKGFIPLMESALASPPRNCDVGTAEEQGDRFAKLCDSYDCCTPCPIKKLWNFKDGHKPSCGVIWGQMLYKAEGEAE